MSEILSPAPEPENEWADKVRRGLQALHAEQRECLTAIGLTEANLVEAGPSLASVLAYAQKCGYDVSRPIGKGQSRQAFLQPDGRVLKLCDTNSFVTSHLDKDDELAFQKTILRELGDDAPLVLVMSAPAEHGLPGIVQERIVPTNRAIKMVKDSDPQLATDILAAHKSNPLVKNHVFEQKVTNSGLIVRNGKMYVVAADTAASGEGDVTHVQGGWNAVRADMAGIQTLDIERFREFPEILEALSVQS